jgi:hypothetical protein
MWEFSPYGKLEEQFQRFERAAAKGHEESIWIVGVVKDVKKNPLIKAFAKTEEPLGHYFTGRLSHGRERFGFFKKSAEGGCSWGQLEYGLYFKNRGGFVEKDEKVYVEWLEKAANQNNPRAMLRLGSWFRNGGDEDDKQKAVSYYRAAAELGWTESMNWLAEMLRDGDGCVKDLRQAVSWGAKGDSHVFWDELVDAKRALESGPTAKYQLCYTFGWGLYWFQYDSERWNRKSDESKAFGNRCIDYYCSCVELQQKSVVEFLLCWNRTTGGIKGPGQMIAQMVWEGREDNLVKTFGGG